jgi:ribose transport system permease protein
MDKFFMKFILKNPAIKKMVKTKIGLVIGIFLICSVFSIASPNFFAPENFANIFRQTAVNILLTLGMTQALIMCNVDLSMGSVVALTAVVMGKIMGAGGSVLSCMAVSLLIGMVVGFINGFNIAYFRLPPFIATLATQTICRGAAFLVTGGFPVAVKSDLIMKMGRGSVFGIPTPFLIALGFVVFTWIVLNKTRLGRYIYAVGGNREAARLAGINVQATMIYVHTMIGFMCSVAGMILMGRLASGAPNIATSYEQEAISASVLGGAVMTGGVGTAVGALLGSFFIGILNNGMTLLYINSYWQEVVRGLVILIVILISLFTQKKKV